MTICEYFPDKQLEQNSAKSARIITFKSLVMV